MAIAEENATVDGRPVWAGLLRDALPRVAEASATAVCAAGRRIAAGIPFEWWMVMVTTRMRNKQRAARELHPALNGGTPPHVRDFSYSTLFRHEPVIDHGGAHWQRVYPRQLPSRHHQAHSCGRISDEVSSLGRSGSVTFTRSRRSQNARNQRATRAQPRNHAAPAVALLAPNTGARYPRPPQAARQPAGAGHGQVGPRGAALRMRSVKRCSRGFSTRVRHPQALGIANGEGARNIARAECSSRARAVQPVHRQFDGDPRGRSLITHS